MKLMNRRMFLKVAALPGAATLSPSDRLFACSDDPRVNDDDERVHHVEIVAFKFVPEILEIVSVPTKRQRLS